MDTDNKKEGRYQNLIIFGFFAIFILLYVFARLILDSDLFSTLLKVTLICIGVGTLIYSYTWVYMKPKATILSDSIRFSENQMMIHIFRHPPTYEIYYSDFLRVFIMSNGIRIELKDGKFHNIREKQVENMIKFRDTLLTKLKAINVNVHFMQGSPNYVSK